MRHGIIECRCHRMRQTKTLVVYYSATGNTAKVAEVIVNENDMDVFAIMPEQPYSTEDLAWTDENSRVSKEHSDPALQDVALLQDTPDNWDSYETVIIGYPIWWGQAAYPVASFVKANDFTGKTVHSVLYLGLVRYRRKRPEPRRPCQGRGVDGRHALPGRRE